MCLKPKQKGYIYLIRTSTFRSQNKYIYKLGKSIEYTIRFNGYDKFSEIYVLYYVEDIDFIEDILIQIFKRKFTHEDMYGKEYFSGAVNDMLQTMDYIINGYGLIEKKDLFNELINNKLKRFIIYNTRDINPFIYEIINDYIDEHNIKKEDINDVSNYNHFYNTYIMNNKNFYNNGKSEKNIKKDGQKIRLKTYVENIDKIEDLDNIIKNKVVLNKNELNKIELNKIELNKNDLNKNDLNKNELNESELNEYELNESELNKSELNESELNESELNESELNESELNESDLNKSVLDKVDLDKNELNKNEFNEYIIKQIVYICHYCIDYKTKQKNDMEKHFNRKKECVCNNTSLSYEDCKELSINKRYYFYFDIFNLRQSDFIEIIKQYNNKENHIYKNNKNDKNKINKEETKNNKIMDKFDKLYYNNITGKYKCIVCSTEYTSKQNMKKHILNQEKCNINKQINDIIELHKSIKK